MHRCTCYSISNCQDHVGCGLLLKWSGAEWTEDERKRGPKKLTTTYLGRLLLYHRVELFLPYEYECCTWRAGLVYLPVLFLLLFLFSSLHLPSAREITSRTALREPRIIAHHGSPSRKLKPRGGHSGRHQRARLVHHE